MQKLREYADELWQIACAKKWGHRCINNCGMAGPFHHFYPKGQYGHLRYDLDNGVNLCAGCHTKIHLAHDPDIIMKIRGVRGEDWYNALREKALNPPQGSYISVKWYEGYIESLGEYIMNIQ